MARFSSAMSWLFVAGLTLSNAAVRAAETIEAQDVSYESIEPNANTANNVWSWPDGIAKTIGREPVTEWKEYLLKDPFGEDKDAIESANLPPGLRKPKNNKGDQINWKGSSGVRGWWMPSISCPYGGSMDVDYYGKEKCIGVSQGICRDGWQFGIRQHGDKTFLMLWREDDPMNPVYKWFPGATQLCIGELYPNVAYLRIAYEENLYFLIGRGAGDPNHLARLKIVPDTRKYKDDDVIVKFRDGPGDDNALWRIFANGMSITSPDALWYPISLGSESPTSSPTTTCDNGSNVGTFPELKQRIAAADNSTNPETITICPDKPIVFESIIDFSDRYFALECLGFGCVFDLDGYSLVTNDDGDGADFSVEIKDITIENGSSSKGRGGETGYASDFGGAILLRGSSPDRSTLTLTNCTFRNNVATSDSGVIDNVNAQIIATDTIFENNKSGGSGGVMWTDGFVSFKNCQFNGNSARDAGGAILSIMEIEISQSTLFQCNSAAVGGALFLEDGSLTMSNAEISANTAIGDGGYFLSGYGGGIFLSEGTESDIENSRFYQNSALGDDSTLAPTDEPTSAPTSFPTDPPSGTTTGNPTYSPTDRPTPQPTFSFPTFQPTSEPDPLLGGGGAIAFSPFNIANLNLNGTVFQNNTSLITSSDDLYENGDTVECGASYGNCFCNADPSPLVAPNITTNDAPTTCAGDGVGPTCTGCASPPAPIVCPPKVLSVTTRTGGYNPTGMDIVSFLQHLSKMIKEKKKGQRRRKR